MHFNQYEGNMNDQELSGRTNNRLQPEVAKRKRYIYALFMILLMIGMAEGLEEKEIIFPEMAALVIGMWIVDKRVWKINRFLLVFLMTINALVGICIVIFSPFPLIVNLPLSFLFPAICLILSRTTLIPQISACMLPVLLQTDSWVYPVAVFIMSLIIVSGQVWMEKQRLREKIEYIPDQTEKKKSLIKWGLLFISLLIIAALPIYASWKYCILPPLVVTYVEFATSKAGFRSRPTQTYLLLVIAATIGTLFQLAGHLYLGLPESVIACLIFFCLFTLFEWSGKLFAPAGAVALVPMIIPQQDLYWFPLQVAIGAAIFISVAMILFQQCYKWQRSQLIVCIIPESIRVHRKK